MKLIYYKYSYTVVQDSPVLFVRSGEDNFRCIFPITDDDDIDYLIELLKKKVITENNLKENADVKIIIVNIMRYGDM